MQIKHRLPPSLLELLRKQVVEVQQRQLALIDQQNLLDAAVREICELVGITMEGGVEFDPEDGVITKQFDPEADSIFKREEHVDSPSDPA